MTATALIGRGFVYLVAVVDVFTRRILSASRVDHDGSGFPA
jgi:hypothetical protein